MELYSKIDGENSAPHEISPASYFDDIHDMCKELTADELDDPKNFWLDTICLKDSILEDQIADILAAISVQSTYCKYFLEICTTLESLSHDQFPESLVYARPFGSTVTQLAFKDSYLDVFLDFNALPEPPEKLLKTLVHIMKQCRTVFQNAVIKSGRASLIFAEHVSGICCHVWLSRSLWVINSELISFYISLDQRVRPLLMLLKLWIKKQNLVGANGLTFHMLSVIAIFYLMLENVSVVPCVSVLQRLSSTTNMIGAWDASFITDSSLVSQSHNQMTVVDLISGFFSYYASFEFGMYVISPFTGKTHLKPLFNNPACLPPELNLYKINLQTDSSARFNISHHLCVQDFFRHDCNITENVSENELLRFQDCCMRAAQICKENIMTTEHKHKSAELFKLLFEPPTPDQEDSLIKNKKEAKTGEEKWIKKIVIPIGRYLLSKNNTTVSEDELRELWSRKTVKIICDIVTKVMKCDATTNSDIHDHVRILHCSMDHLLLASERRTDARSKFDFPSDMFVMEKEEMISDYLWDMVLKEQEKLALMFLVRICIKKYPSRIIVDFKNLEKESSRRAMVAETLYAMHSLVPILIELSFHYMFTHSSHILSP